MAKNSTLAAVGGFLLGPIAVGLVSKLALQAASKPTPQTLTTGVAIAHAVGCGAAWWAASKYPKMHSLLRGAMWGEGVSTVFAAAAANSMISLPAPTSTNTVSATLAATRAQSPQDKAKVLAQQVLTGAWMKAA